MRLYYLIISLIIIPFHIQSQAPRTIQYSDHINYSEIFADGIFKYFVESDNLWRSGNTEQAILVLDEAIAMNPQFAETYIKRAKLFTKTGRINEAQQDLRTAQQLNPFVNILLDHQSPSSKNQILTSDISFYLGLMEDIYGQNEQTRSLIEQAIDASFNGELGSAIKHIEGLFEMETEPNALLYGLRGNTHLLLGNYEEAIHDYTQAIQLEPERSSFYFYRGFTQLFTYNRLSACRDLEVSDQLGHAKGSLKLKYFCNN